jgi:hypothetical protein
VRPKKTFPSLNKCLCCPINYGLNLGRVLQKGAVVHNVSQIPRFVAILNHISLVWGITDPTKDAWKPSSYAPYDRTKMHCYKQEKTVMYSCVSNLKIENVKLSLSLSTGTLISFMLGGMWTDMLGGMWSDICFIHSFALSLCYP